jgi:two-component system response regulator DesR
MSETSLRVALVEDEDLLRNLLGDWLAREPGLELTADFPSCSAFLQYQNQWSNIDVLIVDVRLPDGDGVDLAATFQKVRNAPIPVVVISGRPTAELLGRITASLEGSWAFLLKNSNGLANFRTAIDAVQKGLVMVDSVAQHSLNEGSLAAGISESERSVMRLVAAGESNASVAKQLHISEKTVERLLTSVYQKYGLEGTSKVSNPRVVATLKFLGLM